MKEPTSVGAEDFFSRLCPAVFQQRRELCESLGGIIAFKIRGEGGGTWTVNLGKCSVEPRVSEGVGVYVEMDANDFTALARGALDVLGAQQEGRIVCVGDLGLLKSFGLALRPQGLGQAS